MHNLSMLFQILKRKRLQNFMIYEGDLVGQLEQCQLEIGSRKRTVEGEGWDRGGIGAAILPGPMDTKHVNLAVNVGSLLADPSVHTHTLINGTIYRKQSPKYFHNYQLETVESIDNIDFYKHRLQPIFF